MDVRELDYDAESGIREVAYYDNTDDVMRIQQVQDVDTIIEANKREYNDSPTRFGGDGAGFIKVGSIPLVEYYRLRREGILDDQQALAKYLNDPDNRAWRTRGGKL